MERKWPDLCETLLGKLEAAGVDTTAERGEFAINAYSMAKDGGKKLSANFTVKEFRCKDGTDPIFIDNALVKLLQNIRDHFGKAVTITSAYRTAAHNKAVGCRAWP